MHNLSIEPLTSASSPSSIVSTDTGTGVATRGVGTESISVTVVSISCTFIDIWWEV